MDHDRKVTAVRQAKKDRKKMLVDDNASSEEDSAHLLVENLPKLEINPTNAKATRITIKSNLASTMSINKIKGDGNLMRATHNPSTTTIKINKESHHSRKVSENIQKSQFTIKTNPKGAQTRTRPSSKTGQKSTFELVESQVVASDLNRAKKVKKTISIDVALKKSLFGEVAAKSKGPGALRLSSQFYGPTNLLEVRDKRTKELMSFSFLTRGHLVR